MRDNMNKDIALYLDLDGVFTDFCASAYEIFDDFHLLEGLYSDEVRCVEKKTLRTEMVKTIANKKDFWHTLPWVEGGRELFEFIIDNFDTNNITILTAPLSNDPNCCSGKWFWVNENMNQIKNVIIDDDKYKHVGSLSHCDTHILIDDRYKNVKLFREHGGHAILHHHSDVQKTIESLKEYTI